MNDSEEEGEALRYTGVQAPATMSVLPPYRNATDLLHSLSEHQMFLLESSKSPFPTITITAQKTTGLQIRSDPSLMEGRLFFGKGVLRRAREK